MEEYHRLAADTLLGGRSNKVAVAILQAAETGQLERLQKLLTEHRDLVDARHPDSGDTPLISAARSGHKDVVDVLLSCGADITLESDSGDSVLDVAGDRLRRHILRSISHEDRSMSNAKALLRSAWLGDSVRLRRCLSGSHYLDVNNRNSDGLTPLLLVTRDVSFFSKVQTAMETEYNPVEVLEQLLNDHADVNQADSQGQGPLHLITSSGPSIHATKMVSLLLQHGSATAALSSSSQSALHVASSHGHMTVIVALVEEGGADINLQTSQTGDTPLIISVGSLLSIYLQKDGFQQYWASYSKQSASFKDRCTYII
jgi:mitogen-activated protein kinase kinase kinase 19